MALCSLKNHLWAWVIHWIKINVVRSRLASEYSFYIEARKRLLCNFIIQYILKYSGRVDYRCSGRLVFSQFLLDSILIQILTFLFMKSKWKKNTLDTIKKNLNTVNCGKWVIITRIRKLANIYNGKFSTSFTLFIEMWLKLAWDNNIFDVDQLTTPHNYHLHTHFLSGIKLIKLILSIKIIALKCNN